MASTTVKGQSEVRRALSCAVDTTSCTWFDTSLVIPSTDGLPPTRTDSDAIRMALGRGLKRGKIPIIVTVPSRGQTVNVRAVIRLERRQNPASGARYDRFALEILPRCKKRATEIVVIFSRQLKKKNALKKSLKQSEAEWEHSVELCGSATMILTGQNSSPPEPVLGQLGDDFALQLSLPWLILLAVCKAAQPGFSAPRELRRAVIGGTTRCNAVQLVTKIALSEECKSVALDILHAAYDGMRVARNTKVIETFALGELLGVKSRRRTVKKRDRATALGLVLRCASGSHEIATAAIYSEPSQLGRPLKAGGRRAAPVAVLRIDVTLPSRGLQKLLRGAVQLYATHQLERSKPSQGGGINEQKISACNVSAALAMLEAHFVEVRAGIEYRGLRGWLMLHILFDLLHIEALLGFEPKRVRMAEEYLEREANRNNKIRKAFIEWSSPGNVCNGLYACLRSAKLSPDTAARHRDKVEAFGIPTGIPLRFWVHFCDARLTWGASDEQLRAYHSSLSEGKPTRNFLQDCRRRVKPLLREVYSAFVERVDALNLSPAPLLGLLHEHSPPVESEAPSRQKKMVVLPRSPYRLPIGEKP